MWHLIWTRDPGVTPPVGVTMTARVDGTVAVEGARDAVSAWQLALLKGQSLAPSDLVASGEGAAAQPPPVEISATKAKALADLEAIDASKATVTQLRTAIAAVKAAGG